MRKDWDQGFVTSPCYNLNTGRFRDCLYHIDLYRTDSLSQIEDLGISDLFGKGSIVLIEWAEKALDLLPENCRRVRFELISENERRITTDESARH